MCYPLEYRFIEIGRTAVSGEMINKFNLRISLFWPHGACIFNLNFNNCNVDMAIVSLYSVLWFSLSSGVRQSAQRERLAFPHESVVRPVAETISWLFLVGVNVLSFRQCFDIIGWAAG